MNASVAVSFSLQIKLRLGSNHLPRTTQTIVGTVQAKKCPLFFRRHRTAKMSSILHLNKMDLSSGVH